MKKNAKKTSKGFLCLLNYWCNKYIKHEKTTKHLTKQEKIHLYLNLKIMNLLKLLAKLLNFK